MNADIVADVGNTRVKWGRCSGGAVVASASLPPDDPAAWREQLDRWGPAGPLTWAVAGVHPQRRQGLLDWLRQRGERAWALTDWRQLPLRVLLERPERVGIDRLLDAVAANRRRPAGVPAAVIDAGSAVTVDWLDEAGAFAGGAIFPGLRLMAQALHEHTALLPLIEVPKAAPPLPGTSTPAALAAGVYWAVAGGIRALLEQYAAGAGMAPAVFLTGGDGPLLQPALGSHVVLWPHLTLEGLRLTAEASGTDAN